ncbi:MAG: hypothetical protein ACTTI3_07675 [Treponema sp.]
MIFKNRIERKDIFTPTLYVRVGIVQCLHRLSDWLAVRKQAAEPIGANCWMGRSIHPTGAAELRLSFVLNAAPLVLNINRKQ